MPRGRRGPHSPTAPRAPFGATLAARLRHYTVEDPDGCWSWNGPWLPSHQAGYLVIDGRKRLAHRIAWELAHGQIPQAHRVIRACAQPRCINPAHRTLVAHQAIPRKAAAPPPPPPTCPYGHAYDESNTIWQRGSRVCRECHRRRNRERWQRLRAGGAG
jgi:HNH endonuclease